jgi:hypothetical protein
MASGASITVTGGFGMQQVVAGTDLVLPADFNNARSNIDRLLGTANAVTLGTFTASNTYGYGQGGAGVGAASTGSNILATGASGAFKDLQDDTQALCAFLGQTLRTGVGTDVTTATTITAATWNNLMLNVKDCWDNRFSPASRTASTTASATRTTAWTNTLTQETTWTFASQADCRAFFNGGGAVGASASRSGGSATAQNTQWSNALSNLSDVWLYHDTCTAGAGSTSGIGFYELTTSYQQLVIYYGGASPYTSDYVQVNAKINSTTTPTVVSIQVVLVDADDNVIDDSTDGTLTINSRRNQPDANGSGFSFPVPTGSTGAITGS